MRDTTVFGTRGQAPLLADVALERLRRVHARRRFSAVDVRDAVRRAADALAHLPVTATAYRGGLELQGAEVDHVWLGVVPDDDAPWVVDVAFPLFAPGFVTLLRQFVVGEVEREQLEEADRGAGVELRVVGRVPSRVRYCGVPVWSGRAGR